MLTIIKTFTIGLVALSSISSQKITSDFNTNSNSLVATNVQTEPKDFIKLFKKADGSYLHWYAENISESKVIKFTYKYTITDSRGQKSTSSKTVELEPGEEKSLSLTCYSAGPCPKLVITGARFIN